MKAAQRLNVMVDCPERLWPGYTWAGFQIVLIDSSRGRAIIWNDLSRKTTSGRPSITEYPASRFPAISPGNFKYSIHNGKKALLVSYAPRQNYEDLIRLAIHEGFHQTGQSNIPAAQIRGDVYPEDWHARHLRIELINALLRALRSASYGDLAAASYWYGKNIELHSEDFDQNRAIYHREGTAEYMGQLGGSLAGLGCQAGDKDLIKQSKRKLPKVVSRVRKDNEPYILGLVVCLLLKQHQIKGWQEQIEHGESMFGLLLGTVKPKPQKEDEKLAQTVRDYYTKRNAELGDVVDRIKNELTSPSYYVIAVPDAWRVGSYSTTNHVIFAFNNHKLLLTLRMNARFTKPETTQTIQIRGQDTGRITFGKEQSRDFVWFTLPKDALKAEAGGTYSIHDELVDATGLRFTSERPEGFTTWLFAE